MNRYIYEAIFTPNTIGGYDVCLPDFGIMTQGDSLEDAAYMAQDALSLTISLKLKQGELVGKTGSFHHPVPEGSTSMGIMVLAEPTAITDSMMTPLEAAEILGVTRSRVYTMIKNGQLTAVKDGNNRMVTSQSVMERFNNPVAPGRPSASGPRHSAEA